jgi:hypothetical protein
MLVYRDFVGQDAWGCTDRVCAYTAKPQRLLLGCRRKT